MITILPQTLRVFSCMLLSTTILAGCVTREKTTSPVTTAYKTVKAQIGKKKRTEAVNASIRNITRAEVDAIPRPMVLRIEALKNRSLGTAADIGENNGTLTITMATGNTIHLKNGIMTGTRGLGTDLITLETSNETIREALAAGTTKRIYRHLDSEGQLHPFRVTCTITSEAPKTITLIDRIHNVTPVIETCKSDPYEKIDQTFENIYLIDIKTDKMWQSIQWISAESEYFKIDVLKQP